MRFWSLLGTAIVVAVAVATAGLLTCERVRRLGARGPSPGAVSPAPVQGAKDSQEEPVPLPRPLADARIVVTKAERRLRLYSGDEVVRTYRVGLGFSPEGDKEREGDGRTPEGEFHVCTKNPRSRYLLSLGLSYPNKEDADRGLRDGLISQAEHDRIVQAINGGKTPPWNTALGGEVFIHGRGSHRDWTLGCVALNDDDIRELYGVVPVGTPVTVRP